MELRLRSAAAAAIWLAQCRRAAVGTAPPAGQAGSSGSSGFEPRAGRWAGLPRCALERRLAADGVHGRARGRPAQVSGCHFRIATHTQSPHALQVCSAMTHRVWPGPAPRGAAPGTAVQHFFSPCHRHLRVWRGWPSESAQGPAGEQSPVAQVAFMTSITFETTSSSTATSTFDFGRKST